MRPPLRLVNQAPARPSLGPLPLGCTQLLGIVLAKGFCVKEPGASEGELGRTGFLGALRFSSVSLQGGTAGQGLGTILCSEMLGRIGL